MPSGLRLRTNAQAGAKCAPSGAIDASCVNSTLIVRRVGPEDVDTVRAVLAVAQPGPSASGPALSDRLGALVNEGGVFVLGDVALGPGAMPVGAAVFELDRPNRIARLECLVISAGSQERALSRRLIDESTALLRADGIESVEP